MDVIVTSLWLRHFGNAAKDMLNCHSQTKTRIITTRTWNGNSNQLADKIRLHMTATKISATSEQEHRQTKCYIYVTQCSYTHRCRQILNALVIINLFPSLSARQRGDLVSVVVTMVVVIYVDPNKFIFIFNHRTCDNIQAVQSRGRDELKRAKVCLAFCQSANRGSQTCEVRYIMGPVRMVELGVWSDHKQQVLLVSVAVD